MVARTLDPVRPSPLYRRWWVAAASLLALGLATVGLVATPLERWPVLAAALGAVALGAAVWSMTDACAPHSEARRTAALAGLAVLVAVGAGHVGGWAVAGLAVVALACPWWLGALTRSPRRRP